MAVKLLDKKEWTKEGRKWIFYDYVKNLDGRYFMITLKI